MGNRMAEAVEAQTVTAIDGMTYGTYSSGPGLKRLAAVVGKSLSMAWATARRIYSAREAELKKAGARNQMQRAGFGLMMRPENSMVSRCPTQAPSS